MRHLFLIALLTMSALSWSDTARSETATELTASSVWRLDYAKETCELARTFGSGPDEITLYLRRGAPVRFFDLTLAGRVTGQAQKSLRYEGALRSSRRAQIPRFGLDRIGRRWPPRAVAGAQHVRRVGQLRQGLGGIIARSLALDRPDGIRYSTRRSHCVANRSDGQTDGGPREVRGQSDSKLGL